MSVIVWHMGLLQATHERNCLTYGTVTAIMVLLQATRWPAWHMGYKPHVDLLDTWVTSHTLTCLTHGLQATRWPAWHMGYKPHMDLSCCDVTGHGFVWHSGGLPLYGGWSWTCYLPCHGDWRTDWRPLPHLAAARTGHRLAEIRSLSPRKLVLGVRKPAVKDSLCRASGRPLCGVGSVGLHALFSLLGKIIVWGSVGLRSLLCLLGKTIVWGSVGLHALFSLLGKTIVWGSVGLRAVLCLLGEDHCVGVCWVACSALSPGEDHCMGFCWVACSALSSGEDHCVGVCWVACSALSSGEDHCVGVCWGTVRCNGACVHAFSDVLKLVCT